MLLALLLPTGSTGMELTTGDYMTRLIQKAGGMLAWGLAYVAVEGTMEEVTEVVSRLCELVPHIEDEGMRHAIEDVLKGTCTQVVGDTSRAYWPSLLVADIKYVKG